MAFLSTISGALVLAEVCVIVEKLERDLVTLWLEEVLKPDEKLE